MIVKNLKREAKNGPAAGIKTERGRIFFIDLEKQPVLVVVVDAKKAHKD